MDFAKQGIEGGFRRGIHDEKCVKEAEALGKGGFTISSSFVIWQEDIDGNEKAGF